MAVRNVGIVSPWQQEMWASCQQGSHKCGQAARIEVICCHGSQKGGLSVTVVGRNQGFITPMAARDEDYHHGSQKCSHYIMSTRNVKIGYRGSQIFINLLLI